MRSFGILATLSLLLTPAILFTGASGELTTIATTSTAACRPCPPLPTPTTIVRNNRTVEPFPPKPQGVLTFGAFIYPKMDLLDIMGVLRVFGAYHPKFNTTILLVGETMDPVMTDQQVKVTPDMTIDQAPYLDYFFLPGGKGTADVIANDELMGQIHERIVDSRWCLTVCTGAAILAATGLADDRYMTTNKLAWNKFIDYGPNVKWVKRARWVQDGKYVSSSGVSAGMDMAFDVISRQYGESVASELSRWIEYTRHIDADDDPFSDMYPDNRDSPLSIVPTHTRTR